MTPGEIKGKIKKDEVIFVLLNILLSVIFCIIYFFLDVNKFETELKYKKKFVFEPLFKVLKEDFTKIHYQVANYKNPSYDKNLNLTASLSLIKNYKCKLNYSLDNRKLLDLVTEEQKPFLKVLSWTQSIYGKDFTCLIDLYSLNKEIEKYDNNFRRINYYIEYYDDLHDKTDTVDITGAEQIGNLFLKEKLKLLSNIRICFGYKNTFIESTKQIIIKNALLISCILFLINSVFYYLLRKLLLLTLCKHALKSKYEAITERNILSKKNDQLVTKYKNLHFEYNMLNTIKGKIISKAFQNLKIINKISQHLTKKNNREKNTWLSTQVFHLSDQISEEGIKIYNDCYINIKQLIHNGLKLFDQRIKDKNLDVSVNLSQELIFVNIDLLAVQQIIFSTLKIIINRLMRDDKVELFLDTKDNYYIFTIKDNSLNDLESESTSEDAFFLDLPQLIELVKFYGFFFSQTKEKNFNLTKICIIQKHTKSESYPEENNIINMQDYAKNK